MKATRLFLGLLLTVVSMAVDAQRLAFSEAQGWGRFATGGRTGEIEAWGRGIERIIGDCKAAGCPDPTFRYSTGEMWSVFHFSEEYKSFVSPNDTKDDTKQDSTAPDAAPVTAPIAAPEKDSLDIIIHLIKETPNIRKSDIAANLGITVRGVRYHIEKLKKDGRLFWEGNSRNGHWVY